MKTTLLLLLCAAAPVAVASESAYQRCRAVVDDRLRLACYDAIVPATTPSTATAPKPPPDSFGLPAAPAADVELRTRIVGRFEGWDPQTVLQFENGQRWQIADGSRTAYALDSPRVSIKPGAFGGFMMEIDGVSQRPRVRRLK